MVVSGRRCQVWSLLSLLFIITSSGVKQQIVSATQLDACAIGALSLTNQRLVFHCDDQSESFNLSVILPGTALESTQALDTEF